MDQTARFCGMAIPARNWTTLMNWREKNNSTGDVITHKWGEESKRYITDLITTLQAGLFAGTDGIVAEDAANATVYTNVLVVKEGNENSEKTKALIAALQSDAVKAYIESTFPGSVVPCF